MRFLLESSWMKFGPAGRDSLDWSTSPSALPSTDQAPGSGSALFSGVSVVSVVVLGVSLLLLLFVLLFVVAWRRRRRRLGLGGKLGLANVIALEDLQDPERSCQLLSSLRRSGGGSVHRPALSSSSSEQEVADGVFLMVFLPSPYEHTLTRIARAASTSSSNAELLPPSPGPEGRGGGATEGAGPQRGSDQEEEKKN